jgi:ABC-2 type transport system ATP-binding protein
VTEALLEAESLSKTFGGARPALDQVSFRLEGTGAIGYLGPNGAGKTTTLKLLVGLLRPSSGRVRVNGFDPVADRKRALWDVGAQIETPEPYPTLTVYDALAIVGRSRGLSPDDIDAEIDRCHAELELPELSARVGGLSKGQNQRVALAATLVGDPRILLLDEPTSGLDPAERRVVRRLLGRLKRDHLILMSSHQMVEVSDLCDELMFLDRGRLVLHDRVERIAERVRHREVDVEFSVPVGESSLEPLRALGATVTALSDRRYRLAFDGADTRRAELLATCQRTAPVVQFANTFLVVEEAYLELIAHVA